MNFVKLYIGDYQRDTGHLSIAEHGAYLLMLQHFYATEKPLPTGKALHRLLRAESKGDREAIDSVVRQFWTEADGGLVNGRAREEMAKAADSEEDAEARRAHERERQQRARERRAAMYEELRSRGITPPFDATTAQLRSLLDTSVTPPVTRDDHATVTPEVTANVTRDVTANQTPDTRHQTPDKGGSSSRGGGTGEEPPGPKPPRGSRFALDLLPEDWRAFCSATRPDLDPGLTFARFGDYWRAQPGQRGVRVDWPATWRNWCRNERPGRGQGTAPMGKASALAEHNRNVAKQFAAMGDPDAVEAARP